MKFAPHPVGVDLGEGLELPLFFFESGDVVFSYGIGTARSTSAKRRRYTKCLPTGTYCLKANGSTKRSLRKKRSICDTALVAVEKPGQFPNDKSFLLRPSLMSSIINAKRSLFFMKSNRYFGVMLMSSPNLSFLYKATGNPFSILPEGLE